MDSEKLHNLMETNEPVGKAIIRASALLTTSGRIFQIEESHIYWMIQEFDDVATEWNKAVSGEPHEFNLVTGKRLGYTPNEAQDGFKEWDNNEDLKPDYKASNFLKHIWKYFEDYCKNCGQMLTKTDSHGWKCSNGCHPNYYHTPTVGEEH